MAENSTDALFLQVDASVELLRRHMAEGEQPLDKFAAKAETMAKSVDASIAAMGAKFGPFAKLAEDAASRAQRAFEDGFSSIEKMAAKAITTPRFKDGTVTLGAADARAAAEEAQRYAGAVRLVEQAARQAAAGEGVLTAEMQQYLNGARAATIEAERHAADLMREAGAIEQVEIELNKLGNAQGNAVVAGGRVTAATGQQKQGLQQLTYQLSDIATQWSANTPVMIIFAQQSGQVIQALQLMGAEGKGVLGFLGGPWGMALTAATVVLLPFVGKLIEGNAELDKAVKKLKDDAHQTDIDRQAKEAFTKTIEGQIDAQRRLNDELDRTLRTQRQVAQKTLLDAQNNLADEKKSRDKLVKDIADSDKALKDLLAAPPDNRNVAANTAYAQRVKDAQQKLADLKSQQAALDASIAQGEIDVNKAQAPLVQEEVTASLDKRAAATLRYTEALGKLNAQLALGAGKTGKVAVMQGDGTFKPQTLTGISVEEYRTRLRIAEKARDDAIKAAQEEKRKGPEPTPTLELLKTAESYKGASERGSGREILQTLFKQAGITIDPEMTAWCAAFVNAVLATKGLKGTGSNAARSFLNYGSKTDTPQKGDIVVLRRGTNPAQGHVGFFEGYDKKGNVQVLGGNTGNKVGVASYKPSDVLGYRRAPGSAQSEGELQAKEDARAADAQRQIADANAEYLRVAASLTANADDRLDVAIAAIAAERETRDREIDRAVIAGKLTTAEGDQLKASAGRLAQAKEDVARNKDIARTRTRELDTALRELDGRAAILQLQLDQAKTLDQRRAIAQQLLDLDLEERRKRANDLLKSHNPDDQARGQADLDQINREEPFRREQVNRQYEGPMDQYRRQLKDATGDMDTALQNVQVHGLQSLEDGLLGVVNGTETVAGAFKKMAMSIIADLARIAIEKLIVKAIGGGILGFAGGTVGGSGQGSPGFASGRIPGFAGGIIHGAGNGTSDSILALMEGFGAIRVSNGESIMTAQATRRFGPLLKAMNDNRLPGFATGMVMPRLSYPRIPSAGSMRGHGERSADVIYVAVDKSELFDVHVQRATAPQAQAAMLGGARLAREDFADERMQAIPT